MPRESWPLRFVATKETSYYKQPARITVEAGLHKLGDQVPYFCVTGDIRRIGARDSDVAGCIHDDVLQHWPELAPVVAMHLSDETGVPMHAEANGYYWLAGALGGLGERFHGASSTPTKTADECLQIFAEHCRLTLDAAKIVAERVSKSPLPRATWSTVCATFVERWQREADNAKAVLIQLGATPA